MNGAEALVHTLLAGGIDTCFANPGTSEMHFVAALDRISGMRCVLGLFEGVVTGAADGYTRMADKPAATLLHLGPGLANGLANLHNARRAGMPIVNIVGDHATYHRGYDAPLTSDVEGVARPFSHWVRTAASSRSIAADGADAIAAAMSPPGQIATLILPADAAWGEAPDGAASAPSPRPPRTVAGETIDAVAHVLRSGEPAMLLVTGMALRERGLALAQAIAASTGARLAAPTQNPRIARGTGRVPVERVPYPVDAALAYLKDVRHLILVGAKPPVAFFAYPGKPSVLTDAACEIHTLATAEEDLPQALADLADALGVRPDPAPRIVPVPSALPDAGSCSPERLAASLAVLLPEQAIVIDEAISASRHFYPALAHARPHDWIHLTGGAIGDGLPLATGAAIACPDRKVVCLQADGSALYTLQALWTQARENLDVTTLLLNNRSYETLKGELANVGAQNAGRKALDMMSLDRPAIDWAGLARSMGVEAVRATTMDEFNRALRGALGRRGPFLIEALA